MNLKRGDLLLANEYQVRRGDPISALVLGISPYRPNEYEVFLTNGFTHYLGENVIRDLFVLVSHEAL